LLSEQQWHITKILVLPRRNLSLALRYTLQARGLAAEAPIYQGSDFANWRQAYEGKFVLAVSIDLKNPFETISRDIILHKLQYYGIKGTALKWLAKLPLVSTQLETINDQFSSILPCDIGVPQGSVLGPLLFILSINDMPHHIDFCDSNLFADDTLHNIVGDDLQTMCKKSNKDLDKIIKFCEANKLTRFTQKNFNTYLLPHLNRRKTISLNTQTVK
jgi:hypothetical protein